MGCLFAAQLASAGCKVTLLLRNKPNKASGYVTVESDGVNRNFAVGLGHAPTATNVTHLLVSTKAQDVEAAVRGVAPHIDKQACILFATNGMGYAEEVKVMLPRNPIYYATSTEGAYRLSPLHICHAGRGQTRIGSAEALPPPPWLDDWSNTALDCRWEENITAALWHKLAINCAINPLTAVHHCHNGDLAKNKQLAAEVKQLCDEIARISLAAGFALTAESVHSDVAAVIAGTADNRSSMLQDVIAGRDTEIDYITGHLLRTAEKFGTDAPHNRNLMNEVVSLG